MKAQQREIERLSAGISGSLTSSGRETSTNIPWNIVSENGLLNTYFTGNVNMQGNTVFDIKKITGYLGRWSVDEEGKIIASEIETQKIKSQKGYAVPDEDTGDIYCIKVKSGLLVAVKGECGSLSTSGSPSTSSGDKVASTTEDTTATSTPDNTAISTSP